MSTDWGPIPANTVIPFIFTSHDAATGANETMSGLALADILVYKGVSLTQRSSTAGFAFFGGDADGLDLDTFTGVNGISIDTGDNTDAGFYAVGSLFTVVLGPITVDGQTVYTVLGTFRLVAAEAIAGKPKADVDAWLGTAAATPTVAGVPEVDVTHVGGTAQTAGDLKASLNTIDDFLDTEIATLIGYGAPPTAAVIADAVLDEDMTAHQTLGSLGQAIGDPVADTNTIYKAVVTDATGATVGVDVVAVKAETAAILVDTGTTLDGRLPAVLVGGRMDSSVGAMAANVLTAAATAADFLAEINAEVADVLKTDTTTEPAQAAPTETPTMQEMLAQLYFALIHRLDVDNSGTGFKEIYNAAGVVIWKKAISDAASVYSEAKAVIGP